MTSHASTGYLLAFLSEVAFEPLACQPRYFVQRARFFEKVRRPVQLENLKIAAAHYHQGRRPDTARAHEQ